MGRVHATSNRDLRTAFGRYATGVVVLTAFSGGGRWSAVTINSFTSVSLEPPLLLFGLGKSANCRPAFERCSTFAASILRHDQQWISDNFARPSSSLWDEVPCRYTPQGCLAIDGALAIFQCRRYAVHDGGDHVLIVGVVEHFELGPAARPLTFFQGTYGSCTPDQSAAPPALLDDSAQEFTLGWG